MPHPSLKLYKTEELKEEILRREEEEKEKEALERKFREVLVECPNCKGTGEHPEWREGMNSVEICSMCRGKKTIIALRAKE